MSGPDRERDRFLRALPGLALLVAAACGGSGEGALEPQALARGFEPRLGDPERLWFWAPIAEGAWSEVPGESRGLWAAPSPFEGCSLPYDLEVDPRLELGGALVPPAGPEESIEEEGAEARFRLGVSEVRLRLPPGERPSGTARLGRRIRLGEPAETALGHVRPAWRIRLGKVRTDAIPVLPGEPQVVLAEVEGPAELRFATSCVGPASAGAGSGGKLTARVFAGASLLATFEREVMPEAVFERRAVPLAGHEGEVELRFEVEGPQGLLVLHTPTIAPAAREPGAGAKSGASEELPDLVLFVADTFRADNLAAYGGTFDVAPNLDRFAQRSRVYANAWSPAAWTLPSHASMFSGLHPYRHGSTRKLARVNSELVLLAEWLSAAGYRTAAVTNGLYVSITYGMDRGFEWFEERLPNDLDGTLASATRLLDADDGRPTFLLVHSYRVHGPYTVSRQTIEEHDERLGLREGLEVFLELARDGGNELDPEGEQGVPLRQVNFGGRWFDMLRGYVRAQGVEREREVDDRVRWIGKQLHHVYLGGVIDFDRGVEPFLRDLEARGLFEEGFLFFTSDHGEAFAEHETLFHGHGVWDECLRIPLLLRGRGIPPGRDERYASLVDLPLTIAELVGIPPAPGWTGESLVAQTSSRAGIVAFDCADPEVASTVVVEDGWKIALPLDAELYTPGEVRFAYDLRGDPGETEDRKDEERARIAALLVQRAMEIRRLLVPLVEADEVDLDESLRHQMRALGY